MLYRVHLQPIVVDAPTAEDAKAKAALLLVETGAHLYAEPASPGEEPTKLDDCFLF